MNVFVGIDIGTTSMKAAAFDENGKRLALKITDYTLDTDSDTGFIEFPAENYYKMCVDALNSITDEVGQITAVSVDTQGETIILADEDGNALYPAVVWLDNRAAEEAGKIKEHFGNRRVYEVTGQPEITAGWPASKLLWFREHKPDVWGKVKKIFLLEDYILYKLTGRYVTEPTIQSSTIYYDITHRAWWDEMLDFIGITKEMLPELHKSAEVIGDYRGIPVVTGGLDQIAGAIGVGAVKDNVVSEMTGTIMAICVMSDSIPPYREDCIIPCHIHAIGGKYCLILWSSTAGMALKWFKNQFAESMSFKEIDEIASAVPAGCNGLTMLPYLCGSTMPKYNPEATASFTGIQLSHTKGHFARAILEAVAFTLKQNLDYVGIGRDGEIRITGGGASSPLWSQIKSDVTGKKLSTLTESETACLGTAIMAAVGCGVFPTIEEAAKKLVSVRKMYVPTGTDYSEAYGRYIQIDNKLNNIQEK